MSRYPDSTVFSPDGKMPAMPPIRKVFLMGGTDSKIHKHECLYEGKAGFEKLVNHAIIAQIIVDEDNPRQEGDTHKDIEHTPTGLPSDFLVPRESLMPTNKLWRYLTPFKFQDLITNQQLYYSRLDNFPDNLEGTAPASSIAAIINDPEKNEEQKQQSLRLYKLRMENNRRCAFASCWHINEEINLKMWDAYGENSTDSLAIRTSVSKLERITKAAHLPILNEPVRYFDEPYFNQNAYWFPTMFKRSSFSHEQEFRSIMFAYGADLNGLKIKANPEELITKIYVHPHASKEFFKQIREFVKSKGLKIPISHVEN